MPLDLFMLGLIVKDMPAALAFYCCLGVAVPEGSETKSHVEIKMGTGLTFFLDSRPERWDPQLEAAVVAAPRATDERYPVLLEFYLGEKAALEAKYQELMDKGYQGYRAPYATTFGMIFAMVRDPDGNTLLLSADAAAQQP